MRPIGGPTSDRNALGRWQDRREDRIDGPMGQPRQASWSAILLLFVATVVVSCAIWFAFLFLQDDGDGPDPAPAPAPAVLRGALVGDGAAWCPPVP